MASKNSRNLPNQFEKIKAEAREKRRNILYLILAYLKDNRLEQSAETLIKEAQLDDSYRTCENVELDIILQEYQSYYYTKFQKYPKIVRKLEEEELKPASRRRGKSATKQQRPSTTPEVVSDNDPDFQFEIISLNETNSEENCPRTTPEPDLNHAAFLTTKSVTKWNDCLGLDSAIEVLKEATVYPLRYPEIFKDLITWRGVLLHGPPGTGKTLLAKALAGETGSKFFNVTSSALISKWRGDSEKLLRALFETAKAHAPSTIFFDEIDALITGHGDGQHEASKRFKSELLVHLDGISSSDAPIFVLGSTNSPWELDNALLRRFDKRILVDLPSKEVRIQILRHHLGRLAIKLTPDELEIVASLTAAYSGSDLKNVAKEVAMARIREKVRAMECANGKKNVTHKEKWDVIGLQELRAALQKIKSSVNSAFCKKYYQWQNEHGAS